MPTTLEAAVVVLVLLAPGFIAVRVKNSLLPYRSPSAFHETVEAVILSALLLPIWLIFGWWLLKARHHLLAVSANLVPLDLWAVLPTAGVIVFVYLLISPVLGVLYALVQSNQPHKMLAGKLRIQNRLSAHTLPEVWDRAFSRELQPWVRVVFNDGTAVQGIARFAGLSPAARQLFLVAWAGIPESLVRLDADGNVIEDLTIRAGEGIWVDVGAGVRFVEIFG